MKKRKKKLGLPKYVTIKNGFWHVRLYFPVNQKRSNGLPKYTTITQKC